MSPILIAAIIGTIVLTAGLTWLLWRINKNSGE